MSQQRNVALFRNQNTEVSAVCCLRAYKNKTTQSPASHTQQLYFGAVSYSLVQAGLWCYGKLRHQEHNPLSRYKAQQLKSKKKTANHSGEVQLRKSEELTEWASREQLRFEIKEGSGFYVSLGHKPCSLWHCQKIPGERDPQGIRMLSVLEASICRTQGKCSSHKSMPWLRITTQWTWLELHNFIFISSISVC